MRRADIFQTTCQIGLLAQLPEFCSGASWKQLFVQCTLHGGCTVGLGWWPPTATKVMSSLLPFLKHVLQFLLGAQQPPTQLTQCSEYPVSRRMVTGALLQCWTVLGRQAAFTDNLHLRNLTNSLLQVMFVLDKRAVHITVEFCVCNSPACSCYTTRRCYPLFGVSCKMGPSETRFSGLRC